MPKVDYMSRIRNSGISCMMSLQCSYCFREGKRIAYFGVDPKGRNINRHHDFLKEIWQAAVKHMPEHGKKVVPHINGRYKAINA